MTESRHTVLHYTGYTNDRGGIHSLIRLLSETEKFSCVVGLSHGGKQSREPALPQIEFPFVEGEKISLMNFWRARSVAREVQVWLHQDSQRIFHGHSRAGLLVALWLYRRGETRVVVSVHCYGSQRWFYRWAAKYLGKKLFWLSPAMRAYYGVAGKGWSNCIPGGVTFSTHSPARREAGKLRLGGVGELVPWKHWDVVLRALALLTEAERSQIHFEHIGAGRDGALDELMELRERLGLTNCVKLSGQQPSSEELMARIDALVVASRHEPFSVAMLEALAAGVPVIAADSGGALDVIQPGINGALYATGDPTALAAIFREWLQSVPQFAPEKIRNTTVAIERVAAEWNGVYAQS